MAALRLSVLDQSPALAGVSHDVSLRETLAMARWCEALGYERFWVSEHHGSESIAGSAPEILIAAIAAQTHRIRVGSAGVLLPHYAPLKVAEQFRTLEALTPGRIDLGLGRAPGGEGLASFALNPGGDAAVERFPTHVRDIVAWTSGAPLVEGHPLARLPVTPRTPSAPQVWVLGSSDYGAQVAGFLGLPFCFAHFINDRGARAALDLYRSSFRPSARWPAPHAAVCVFALAAETDADARRIFVSRLRARLDRDVGRRGPLLPPERVVIAPSERARADAIEATAIVGDGSHCAAVLRDLARDLAADEIAILTHAYHLEDRRRSYGLLAEAGDEKL